MPTHHLNFVHSNKDPVFYTVPLRAAVTEKASGLTSTFERGPCLPAILLAPRTRTARWEAQPRVQLPSPSMQYCRHASPKTAGTPIRPTAGRRETTEEEERTLS